jgi:hypothetical protein
MNNLLNKLSYKGQQRILIANADESLNTILSGELPCVRIDREIDQRYPYQFMIIFVRTQDEVELYAPLAIHNLLADGILWFCYPRKSSKKYSGNIDRDHGWKVLNDSGFYGKRVVTFSDDWSALRFRNIKFISSNSAKFKIHHS